MGARVKTVRAC